MIPFYGVLPHINGKKVLKEVADFTGEWLFSESVADVFQHHVLMSKKFLEQAGMLLKRKVIDTFYLTE